MNINPNTHTTHTSTEPVSQQPQEQRNSVQQVPSSNAEGIASSQSLADKTSNLNSQIQKFIKEASPDDQEQIQKAFDSESFGISRAYAVKDIKNEELRKQVAEFIVQNNIIQIENTHSAFRDICCDAVDEKLLAFVMNPSKNKSERQEMAYQIQNVYKRNQAWASIGQDNLVDLSLRYGALSNIVETLMVIDKNHDSYNELNDLYDDTVLSIVTNFNYDARIYTPSQAIERRLLLPQHIKNQSKKDEAYYNIFIDKNNPITDLKERLLILEYVSSESQHLFQGEAFSFVQEVLNSEGLELEHIEKLWGTFSRIVSIEFSLDMLMAITRIPHIDADSRKLLMNNFIYSYIPDAIPEESKEYGLSFEQEVLNLEGLGLELEHIEKLWFAFSPIASVDFQFNMLRAIMNIPDIDPDFCMHLMNSFLNDHAPNTLSEDELENSTAPAA